MNTKIRKQLAMILASVMCIGSVFAVSGCSNKLDSGSTETVIADDDSAGIKITPEFISETNEETESETDIDATEATAVIEESTEPETVYAIEAVCDSASTWYQESKIVNDNYYFNWVTDRPMYSNSCQITSDGYYMNCFASNVPDSIPSIMIFDASNGTYVNSISVNGVMGKETDYYCFVLDGNPYLEMDTYNDEWEIESTKYYEVDTASMTLGEEVELFDDNTYVYEAFNTPTGCCFVTQNIETGEYILVVYADGEVAREVALSEIFGDNIVMCNEVFPYGENALAVSALIEDDDDYEYHNVVIGYGNQMADSVMDFPIDVIDSTVFVDNDGNSFIINSTTINLLNSDGSQTVCVDFNNLYDSRLIVDECMILSYNPDASWTLLKYCWAGEDSRLEYYKLSPTTNNYNDREIITIKYTEDWSNEFAALVNEFNLSNDHYYARLEEIDLSDIDAGYGYLVQSSQDYAVEQEIANQISGDNITDVYLSNSYESYLANAGVFMDLNDYMEDYFANHEGELYESVINSARYSGDNGLYQIPLRVYLTGIFDMTGDNSSRSLDTIGLDYATYEEHVNTWNEEPVASLLSSDEMINELFSSGYANYFVDGELDEAGLADMITYANQFVDEEPDYTWNDVIYSSIYSIVDLSEYSLIPYAGINDYYSLPMPNGADAGVIAGACYVVSIPNNCSNLDGAKAFVEFALSYEGQMVGDYASGMPVNRQAMHDMSVYEAEFIGIDPEEEGIAILSMFMDNVTTAYVYDATFVKAIEGIDIDTADAATLARMIAANYQYYSNITLETN